MFKKNIIKFKSTLEEIDKKTFFKIPSDIIKKYNLKEGMEFKVNLIKKFRQQKLTSKNIIEIPL